MVERVGRGPCGRLAAWYRRGDVRARIVEYCGGCVERPGSFTALGVAGYGGSGRLTEPDGAPVSLPPAALEALLDQGADVCRSLADQRGTLIHLDLDYTNPDDPEEPYRHPRRAFARLEPVYRSVLARLARYSIRPLCLMTARGYHLVVRARRGSPLQTALEQIGTLTDSLRARYERQEAAWPGAVAMGRAHDGAGRLAEQLGHEVLRDLRGRSPVPVTLADVPPAGGGPFVCFDLSAYADPLFGRHIRCAFSSNQKAWMLGLGRRPAFVIVLPRRGSYSSLLKARGDPAAAALLARAESTSIPDAPPESQAWVEDYRNSPVSRFHRAFDRGPQMDRADWPYSYDSLDLRGLPECVRRALESPNPALLAPVFLRTVSLALWGLGWHPRSVAGLVRSRFEGSHGWQDYWGRYDAASRAEFYVRVLSGAVADGLDTALDFTCESQALRGVCTQRGCGHDLGALFPGVARRAARAAVWRPNGRFA